MKLNFVRLNESLNTGAGFVSKANPLTDRQWDLRLEGPNVFATNNTWSSDQVLIIPVAQIQCMRATIVKQDKAPIRGSRSK